MKAQRCTNCKGAGKIMFDVCGVCQGTGKIKLCPRCKRTKPASLTYWYRNKTEQDGLQTYCKSCKYIHGGEKGQRLIRKMLAASAAAHEALERAGR